MSTQENTFSTSGKDMEEIQIELSPHTTLDRCESHLMDSLKYATAFMYPKSGGQWIFKDALLPAGESVMASTPLDDLAAQYAGANPNPFLPPEWAERMRKLMGVDPVVRAPGAETTDPKYCDHEWKEYVGFTGLDPHKFCTKCDERREWNPFFKGGK